MTEHVDVDGLCVAFRRAGSGPPLLLAHGAVCDGRVWRTQLESLSDAFTVVAWDAPGCGESSDPPEMTDGRLFGMADFARCAAAVVDAVQLGAAHVVGHSWGSTLALELWRLRSDLVRSLVLVGGYAGWAGSLPPDEVERRLAFALQAAEALPAFDPRSMPGLFSEAMSAERVDELGRIMSEIRPVGTRVMAIALAEADLRPVLPMVDVPTLVVHGADDVRSTIDVALALESAIAGATLVVLPGCGHESYLEAPDAFDRAVRGFLLAR